MSLYNTNVDDIYRPSFFELIASDRLIPSLQPAIRHSLLILSRHLPQPLPALLASHADELFYALLFLIQRHYLSLYDSTFAENFYGLRRVQAVLPQGFHYRTTSPHTAQLYGPQSVIHDKPSVAVEGEVRLSSLSPSARNVTLVCTVLLPYFQSKLDSHYTELSSPLYNDPLIAAPPQPLSSRQQLFVAVYPYLHALLESVRFFYQCRYLFELSAFFLPSHRWTSQLLRRLSAEDLQKLTSSNALPATSSLALEQAWAASAHLGLLGRLRALLTNLSTRLTSSAKYGLLFALLAVKFLDWYHSPSNPLSQSNSAFASSSSSSPFSTRTRPLASLPIPPPPPLPKASEGGVAIDCPSSVCGLCGRERTNAAADCSGWLFCYPCLFAHVSEYGVCPVTRQPCRLEQIRKIYDT